MFEIKSIVKKINWVYALGIGVFLVFFYGYFYSDILITTSHGINFWDILFEGKLLDFYALDCSDVDNAAYTITAVNAGYDFPIYVLFGIWNFPLWAIRKLTGINIWESLLAMMWAKSIILVFIILTIKTLWKICDTVGMPDRKKVVALIFMTSPILAGSAVVNSQYDIITAFFMLEALDCYLNRRMKGFTGYILAATFIKPFALFIFVPLLLYAEKNVIKIILHSLAVLVPWAGIKLIIRNTTQLTTYSTVLTLFKHKVSIAKAEIPIFFLVAFAFWIICYMYKIPEDKKSFYKNSLMISYVSLAIFFMFCSANPYWIIMLLPFGCLLVCMNKEYETVGIVIETVASICVVGHYVIEIPWCYDVKILRTSYFAKIFGLREDTTDNVLDIIHNISEMLYDMRDRASGFLFGLFFVATLAFIWLNMSKHENIALENEPMPKSLLWIRGVLALGVCLIPMIAFIF